MGIYNRVEIRCQMLCLTTSFHRPMFAVVAIFASVSLSAQSGTPEKFVSPDGKYVVQILQKPMPGADSLDQFTMIISSEGRPLTKVATYGYLISAQWSPDGKYVAINNRRGNAGDYLWVFDLHSGKALKQPDNKDGEAWEKTAKEEVHREHPSANEDTFRRDWVTAKGWEGDQLNVVVRSVYRGMEDAFDFEFLVDPVTWQIKSSKLVKVSPDG